MGGMTMSGNAGVTTEMLAARLETLEQEQQREREETRSLPLRSRLLNQRIAWVRRMLRRYQSVRQLLGGARSIRFDAVGSGNSRLWDIPDIELMHLCIDVELAIESLAWRQQRQETVFSRAARELFIRMEISGESLTRAAHETGLSVSAARACWEHGIEHLWEALADYHE